MTNHWCSCFFPEPIHCTRPLYASHDVELITLASGTQWIVKRFKRISWLGKVTQRQLEFAASMQSLVALQLGITPTLATQHILREAEDYYVLIYPYVEGKIVHRVSPSQAMRLGQCLAEIHALALPQQGACPFPSLATELLRPRWVKQLGEKINQLINYRASEWVVSHRDLHAGNIIWSNKEQFYVIDWESAGLIHPCVELLGLANNCAGIPLLEYNEDLFYCTLQGYKTIAKRLPRLDSELFTLTHHSWLLWYAYGLKSEQNNPTEETLRIIEWLFLTQDRTQQLYQDVAGG